jgi:hypothetical protein
LELGSLGREMMILKKKGVEGMKNFERRELCRFLFFFIIQNSPIVLFIFIILYKQFLKKKKKILQKM